MWCYVNWWVSIHSKGNIKVLATEFKWREGKSEKGYKTIQVLQKDLKLSKPARKSVENSTCLHWDRLEVNTGKSQGNESVLFAEIREKFLL